MADLNLGLLIFLVVTFTQIVSWVGKSVLQDLAFSTYSRIFLASSASKQRALRKQVLEDKAQLSKTSSQDEFAKWAKLRRKVDKGLADLEKANSSLASAKSSFATKFSSLLWIFTSGAQLVLVWWYRKQPIFWLPAGWAPGPVAWLLSFPSAPKGAVSSAAWAAVIKRVLATVEEIVKSLLTPAGSANTAQPPFPFPFPPQGQAPFDATGQTKQPTARVEEIEHEKLD